MATIVTVHIDPLRRSVAFRADGVPDFARVESALRSFFEEALQPIHRDGDRIGLRLQRLASDFRSIETANLELRAPFEVEVASNHSHRWFVLHVDGEDVKIHDPTMSIADENAPGFYVVFQREPARLRLRWRYEQRGTAVFAVITIGVSNLPPEWEVVLRRQLPGEFETAVDPFARVRFAMRPPAGDRKILFEGEVRVDGGRPESITLAGGIPIKDEVWGLGDPFLAEIVPTNFLAHLSAIDSRIVAQSDAGEPVSLLADFTPHFVPPDAVNVKVGAVTRALHFTRLESPAEDPLSIGQHSARWLVQFDDGPQVCWRDLFSNVDSICLSTLRHLQVSPAEPHIYAVRSRAASCALKVVGVAGSGVMAFLRPQSDNPHPEAVASDIIFDDRNSMPREPVYCDPLEWVFRDAAGGRERDVRMLGPAGGSVWWDPTTLASASPLKPPLSFATSGTPLLLVKPPLTPGALIRRWGAFAVGSMQIRDPSSIHECDLLQSNDGTEVLVPFEWNTRQLLYVRGLVVAATWANLSVGDVERPGIFFDRPIALFPLDHCELWKSLLPVDATRVSGLVFGLQSGSARPRLTVGRDIANGVPQLAGCRVWRTTDNAPVPAFSGTPFLPGAAHGFTLGEGVELHLLVEQLIPNAQSPALLLKYDAQQQLSLAGLIGARDSARVPLGAFSLHNESAVPASAELHDWHESFTATLRGPELSWNGTLADAYRNDPLKVSALRRYLGGLDLASPGFLAEYATAKMIAENAVTIICYRQPRFLPVRLTPLRSFVLPFDHERARGAGANA